MEKQTASDSYRQTVSDVRPNVRFEGWLLVKEATPRTTNTGKKFLDIALVDRTGSIPAKWWDFSGEPPAPGTVVRVRGLGNEYNGHLQLRIEWFKNLGALADASKQGAVDALKDTNYQGIKITAGLFF